MKVLKVALSLADGCATENKIHCCCPVDSEPEQHWATSSGGSPFGSLMRGVSKKKKGSFKLGIFLGLSVKGAVAVTVGLTALSLLSSAQLTLTFVSFLFLFSFSWFVENKSCWVAKRDLDLPAFTFQVLGLWLCAAHPARAVLCNYSCHVGSFS